MRRHLVVTTLLIAIAASLPACSSSSSPESSSATNAPAETTTSSPGTAAVLTCTKFAGTLTVSPPISPTVSATHTLSAKGTLSACTGTPGITSGELSLVFTDTAKVKCADLLTYTQPGSTSVWVKWNNGTVSAAAKLAVTYDSVASSTISGKFTGGNAFLGKTTNATTTNRPDGGGCVTSGVSLSTATLSLAPGTEYTIS